MIERDYLMRLITVFFETLTKIINGIETGNPNVKDYILDTYKLLGKSKDFFLDNDDDIIFEYFKSLDGNYLKRVLMLSELMYYDAITNNDANLLDKAVNLMSFYCSNTKEFSFEIIEKLKIMKNKLETI